MKERYAVIAGARFWYIIDRHRGGRTVSRWMEQEGAEKMVRILNRREAAKDGRKEAQEETQAGPVASLTGAKEG